MFARGPCLAASFAVVVGLGASLAAAAPDGLAACLASCDKARLSDTNRATCRLDCEQDAATDPELIRSQIAGSTTAAKKPASTKPVTPAGPAPSGRAVCEAECAADRTLSVDDRETCKLACGLVEAHQGTKSPGPPATGPTAHAGPIAVPTGTPAPAVLGVAPSSFLAMCLETCRKGPVKLSETDHATCRLTCENTASVVDVAFDAAPTGWFVVAPPTAIVASRPASPVHGAIVRPSHPTTTTSAPKVAGSSCQAARTGCEGACDKTRAKCERSCTRQKIETDRETCKLECGENRDLCAADCTGEHASCVNRGGR